MERPTIVQVIRRATQGVTLPFLCEAEDGQRYWVKGRDAGVQALCFEWLAARIAAALGLPVAPFAQVHIPEELVNGSLMDEIEALGAGIGFGSWHVEGADELREGQVGEVAESLRCKVLMFDWWLQNVDRTLGEDFGNVNLLWSPDRQQLAVIDHNQAFSPQFSAQSLCSEHVFRADKSSCISLCDVDFMAKTDHIKAMMDTYYGELPDEWLDRSAPELGTGLERIRRVLDRFRTPDDLFGDHVE